MEILIALSIGLLFACGIYLVLRPTGFSVVLGLTLLAYGVNLLIFVGGGIDGLVPPLSLPGATGLADPLPQALVLTAIVIGFGMTAYLVALALRTLGETGSDHVDSAGPETDASGGDPADTGPGGEARR